MTRPVMVERVTPGLCPGGLWVCLSTATRVVTAHGLGPNDDVEAAALRDRDVALAQGQRVWNDIYDGDSGEWLATEVVP